MLELFNYTGNLTLSDCGAHWVPCSLNMKDNEGVKVMIDTIDHLTQMLVSKVSIMQTPDAPPYLTDLFQIDAEGYDFFIAEGGHRFLERQPTRLLIFEYHKKKHGGICYYIV